MLALGMCRSAPFVHISCPKTFPRPPALHLPRDGVGFQASPPSRLPWQLPRLGLPRLSVLPPLQGDQGQGGGEAALC